MITDTDLTKALNADRDRHLAERRRFKAMSAEPGQARRAVGRWLERLGKRLQGPGHPSRSNA
jgi:hypothetical protein